MFKMNLTTEQEKANYLNRQKLRFIKKVFSVGDMVTTKTGEVLQIVDIKPNSDIEVSNNVNNWIFDLSKDYLKRL